MKKKKEKRNCLYKHVTPEYVQPCIEQRLSDFCTSYPTTSLRGAENVEFDLKFDLKKALMLSSQCHSKILE